MQRLTDILHTSVLSLLAHRTSAPLQMLAQSIHAAALVAFELHCEQPNPNGDSIWVESDGGSPASYVIRDARGRPVAVVSHSDQQYQLTQIALEFVPPSERLYATGGGNLAPQGERAIQDAATSQGTDGGLFEWAETAAVGDVWSSIKTFSVGTAAGLPHTMIQRVV